MQQQGSGGRNPVSYTHLDVYKRQVLKQSVAEAGEKLNKEYVAYMTDEEKDSAANAAKNVFLDVMGAEHTVLTKDMADRMAELEALLKNAYPDITVRIEGCLLYTSGRRRFKQFLFARFTCA